MAKYVVHYEMRQDSKSAVYTKTTECESEYTAVQIAESQGKRDKPGYTFNLRKVDKK